MATSGLKLQEPAMSISALSQQAYSSVYLALGSFLGSSLNAGNGSTSGASPATTPATTPATSTTTSSPSASPSPATTTATPGSQASGLHFFFSAVVKAFARITGTPSASPTSPADAPGANAPAGSATNSSNPAGAGVPVTTDGASQSDSMKMRVKEKIQF